ncbi:MAG: response regulator [Gemmatimonadota bacterium]
MPTRRELGPGAGRELTLVDESALQRALLSHYLRELGFEVTAVATADAALRHIGREPCDALLTDLRVPGMDGFALCRSIREDPKLTELPVVLLSGHEVSEADRLRAAQVGADACIARLPGFAQVVDALLASLNGHIPAAGGGNVLGALRERFLIEGRQEADRLLADLATGADLEASRRIVHGWNGRGGTLGFPQISDGAAEIEARLKRGDREGARAAVAAIRHVFTSGEVRANSGGYHPEPAGGEARATPPGTPGGAPIPDRILQGLFGRQVALVGFGPAYAAALEKDLRSARARSVAVAWPEGRTPPAELEEADLIVLHVAYEPALAPWLEPEVLGRLDAPTLLVGDVDVISRAMPALGQQQLLLTPWEPAALRLRAYLALHSVAERPAWRPSAFGAGGPELVLADDDPTITALVAATLRNSGYRCHLAEDGHEALEMARRLRPQALIIDVNMPHRDGFDVLAALKSDRRSRSVPVILLTARQQETDIIRGFELGAADYVVKPFNPLELLARLRRLVPAS